MREKLPYLFTLPLLLLCLLLSSCGHTLKSESGLYNVKLESSYKLPVKGIWFSGRALHYKEQAKGRVYVAPLNIDAIVNDDPEAAHEMKQMMSSYVKEYLSKCFAEIRNANHTDWDITESEAEADLRVDIAIVHFKRQRPFLRIFTEVASNWSPVPMTSSLAAPLSEGDICIEMTIRDARNHELHMALKDANPGKPRYFQAAAYKSYGNGITGMRIWALKLALVIREAAADRGKGRSLKQRVEDMNLFDVIEHRTRLLKDDFLS